MFTVTNRVRQNESFPLPMLVTAADIARQNDSSGSVRVRESGRERSQEGPVLIGSPSSEPGGGSIVDLEEK